MASFKSVHWFLYSFSAFQYYAPSLKAVWSNSVMLHNCIWHLTWICFSRLGSDILIWKLHLYITNYYLSIKVYPSYSEIPVEHWLGCTLCISKTPVITIIWELPSPDSTATYTTQPMWLEMMGLCEELCGTNFHTANNRDFFPYNNLRREISNT